MYNTIAVLGKWNGNEVLLQHDPAEKLPWRLDTDGGNGRYFEEYEFALAWLLATKYNEKHIKNKLPPVRHTRG